MAKRAVKTFKLPEPDRGPQYMLSRQNVVDMIKDGSIHQQHFLIQALANTIQKSALLESDARSE